MSGRVRTTVDGRAIATVTVCRPDKLNALSSEVMIEFEAAFRALHDVRAVVLTGEGRAFLGGADVAELGALDLDSARAFITRVHHCCEAIRACPAPVIARINGYCLGAGLEIAASCDLRVAARDAVLGMPEVLLGIPSVVEAALLPRLVGAGRAREILLLGKTFLAAQAADWGLLERAVPATELDDVVEGWVGDILACGPNALRLQKALIRQWENLPADKAIAAGIDAFEEAFKSEEPKRMIGGFLAARRKG
jgi:enoyl-CoA hydratase/carnithine racemase